MSYQDKHLKYKYKYNLLKKQNVIRVEEKDDNAITKRHQSGGERHNNAITKKSDGSITINATLTTNGDYHIIHGYDNTLRDSEQKK